ncbi:MAG: phosphoethanolamine--lipid A transferase [Chromatiales bacterium]|nr:MAG: phosphoethanolamine--lipid A transferase [Chromatiales bacterium]
MIGDWLSRFHRLTWYRREENGLPTLPTIRIAPWQLAIAAAVFIIAASNSGLFTSLLDGLDLNSLAGAGFFATIVLLMILVLVTTFLAVGFGWLLKSVIALFLIVSSILAYFCNNLGVVFDQDMLLNIAETVRDKNLAEASELASAPLLQHVFIFGVLPALLLSFVRLQQRRFFSELGVRALVLMAGFVLLAGITLPNYRFVSYFARENSDLKLEVTPIYPLISMVRLTQNYLQPEPSFQVIDAAAFQRGTHTRKSIGIMVIGETARADHFSMAGYEKRTNPLLEKTPGVMFAEADSCGTSTLFSVPCMFSMRGRDSYEPKEARSESNVLDILTAAGIKTVWIDNNSSCKGVCDRIENSNLRDNPDEASSLYSDMGYFDEIFLQEIDSYLNTDGPDTLIVLHTLGSHGPAYGRRYPSGFGVFAPYCQQASPTDCTAEEVANAYDNTIFYTDYLLSQLIQKLRAKSDEVDTFLFYASDHGESLGEGGFYLHGLPYSIAPAAQTNVPFILWASAGFHKNRISNSRLFAAFGEQRLSHDNISHTLLGMYDVSASTYLQELDIFSGSEDPDRRRQLVSATSNK